MSTSVLTQPCPANAPSTDDEERLAEDLLADLLEFGLLPVRRATQVEDTGILRRGGPDAIAIRGHAIAWVDARVGTPRYAPELLSGLRMALGDMSPAEVAGWVKGYHTMHPRILL